MYIQRVSAEIIAVSGTGNTATTTITLPATFIPAAGAVYDILLKTQVPVETKGTIINITNGTVDGNVLKPRTGDYSRASGLDWRQVLRVQYFDDPSHYIMLNIRGVC